MLIVGNLERSLKKLEKKKSNPINLETTTSEEFVIIYSFFSPLPILPCRIYVLKVLKMCRRGPGQEKAVSSWKTKCFTEVRRRKGGFCCSIFTGCWRLACKWFWVGQCYPLLGSGTFVCSLLSDRMLVLLIPFIQN